MFKELSDFLVKLDDFALQRHKNGVLLLKKLSDIWCDHWFTVMYVIQMILDDAVIAYQG